MDLELIIRELIPVRNEGKPLPEAIDLDKVLRKLKVTLTGMISRHQNIVELMMKEDDTKSTGSDHSGSARAEGATSIKLPKLSIPKLNGDILNWRTFWEQVGVSIHSRPQLLDAE